MMNKKILSAVRIRHGRYAGWQKCAMEGSLSRQCDLSRDNMSEGIESDG